MSHFMTLVLVDEAEPDPVARAEGLMAAYWGSEFFDEETGCRLAHVKCDGFVVGGQYDGVIWGKEQHYNLKPGDYQRRYGLDVVRPEDNARPVSRLVPDLLPYAVITPDGEWFERDRLSEQAWRDEVRSLLDRNATRMAVAIDCHC
jgi:hypothetical protein